MPDTPLPSHNRILANLPPVDIERLAPALDPVRLGFAETLQDTGQVLDTVYFPTTSVLSLMRYAADGDTVEVALTGDEGVVGVAGFLGDGRSANSVLVKRAGHAFRLNARLLREEVARNPLLESTLLEYVQALVSQLAQTGLCNRLHNAEERLCRCLLQLRDRQPSDELELTHEFLSRILGMRRSGVTVAIGELQDVAAIRLKRGIIEVLDREVLEHRACECYAILREETEALSPPPSH